MSFGTERVVGETGQCSLWRYSEAIDLLKESQPRYTCIEIESTFQRFRSRLANIAAQVNRRTYTRFVPCDCSRANTTPRLPESYLVVIRASDEHYGQVLLIVARHCRFVKVETVWGGPGPLWESAAGRVQKESTIDDFRKA